MIPRQQPGHLSRIEIRRFEVDRLGLLPKSSYLGVLERALIHWAETSTSSYDPSGGHRHSNYPVIQEYAIHYHQPAPGPGAIGVRIRTDAIGLNTLIFRFRMEALDDSGTLHAQGRLSVVQLSVRTMRPEPWTADVLAAARTLLTPK